MIPLSWDPPHLLVALGGRGGDTAGRGALKPRPFGASLLFLSFPAGLPDPKGSLLSLVVIQGWSSPWECWSCPFLWPGQGRGAVCGYVGLFFQALGGVGGPSHLEDRSRQWIWFNLRMRFQLNWFQMCSAPQLAWERQGGAGEAFCCPWSHLDQANSWNITGFGELVLHLTQKKGWFGLSCFQSLDVKLCRNSVRILEKVSWHPAQEDAQTQMFPGDEGMSIPQQGLTSGAPGSLWETFPEGQNPGMVRVGRT